MPEVINLEVVTPDRVVVGEDAQIVMAPGTDGEFGILAGHTPFLTSLKVGVLRYKDTAGTEKSVFVSGGFAEALPDKVTVLAESAEKKKNIDLQRAQKAQVRAEKRITNTDSVDVDFLRAKLALTRAITRIKFAS